ELLRIWRKTKKSILFVTHNIEEAVFLGDKVVVMGDRPSTLKEEVSIDISRPRDLEIMKSDEYHKYVSKVRDLMKI
ncbi:hypothetical protein AKJ62_04525, partial [candidate division MSBL1 archaeon SCGC-AAA259D14]